MKRIGEDKEEEEREEEEEKDGIKWRCVLCASRLVNCRLGSVWFENIKASMLRCRLYHSKNNLNISVTKSAARQ